LEPSAWDAWDGARRGEAADVPHQLLALLADEDAGKSADRARAVRAQDASFPPEFRLALLVLVEQDVEAEPYRPDVVRSAEQSCAAQVFAARQQPAERLDAVCSAPREQQVMRKRSSTALQAQAEQPPLVAALQDEAAVRPLPGPLLVLAAQQEPVASQPLAAQSQDAQQERASAERKRELAAQAAREQQASQQVPRMWASAERPAARDAAAQAQPQLPSSA